MAEASYDRGYVYLYKHMYIYIYMHIHVCMYVYIYMREERNTSAVRLAPSLFGGPVAEIQGLAPPKFWLQKSWLEACRAQNRVDLEP